MKPSISIVLPVWLAILLVSMPKVAVLAQNQQFLPVIVKGKWGVINKNGQVLVQPKYDFMPVFSEFEMATIIENGKMGVIDTLGNSIVPSEYDDIRVINRQVFLVSQQQRWGVLKKNQSLVLPIQYSQILPQPDRAHLLLVKDSLRGMADLQGNLKVPVQYEDAAATGVHNYFQIKQNGGWGIYQAEKGEVFSAKFDAVTMHSAEMVFFQQNKKWGGYHFAMADTTLPAMFDTLTLLTDYDPFVVTHLDRKKGLYTLEGKELIPTRAMEFHRYNAETLLFRDQNNRWGIIDSAGNLHVQPQWYSWERLNADFISLMNKKGGKSIYSCEVDSVITPPRFNTFERFTDDYLIAKGENISALLHNDGRLIAMGDFESYQILSEGMVAAQEGVEWRLFTQAGKPILPKANIKQVSAFRQNPNVARVQVGARVGLLTPEGDWFIKPEYLDIKVFDGIIKTYGMNEITMWYLDETGNITDRMTFTNVSVARVASLEEGEQRFTPGQLSDSTATRFSPETVGSSRNQYVSFMFGTFKNRWALRNMAKNVFKDLEKHQIMRFMYTFGERDIRFGWMMPRRNKEQLAYSKKIYNRPQQLHIAYMSEFNEGLARVNIGGLYTIVGKNPETMKYALDSSLVYLMRRNHHQILDNAVGRTEASSYRNANFMFMCRGGYWGFINEAGNVEIDFDYEYVTDFHDGIAIAKKRGRWGVINPQNEVVIPFEYSYIDYLPGSNNTLLRLHSEKRLYGYVDSLGRQVVPTQFEEIGKFNEGIATARQEGKWGVIDTLGNWVIPNEFDALLPFSEGKAAALQRGLWGFINRQGQWVIEPQYRSVGSFAEGKAPAKQTARFGYINESGTWVIEPQFQETQPFVGEVAIARFRGKYGLIDPNGKWIIKPSFQKIEAFDESFFIAKKKGYGLIDMQGKPITSFKYFSIEPFQGEYAKVRKSGSNFYKSRFGLLNREGKEIIPTQYNYAGNYSEGLMRVKNIGEPWRYINLEGKEVFSVEGDCTDFREGKAIVFTERGRQKGGKFINQKGELVLNLTQYEAIENFQNGRGIVRHKRTGVYAYIDSLGQIITQKKYYGAMPFQYKVSFVKEKKKWGITNLAGIPVSEFKFDSVEPFDETGYAKVEVRMHFGIIDKQGNTIAAPHFETIKSVGEDILMVESADRLGYIHAKKASWIWPLQN